MKHQIYSRLSLLLLLSACNNPGGISDSEYAKFRELGAPKILYSCTLKNQTDPAFIKAVRECLAITNASQEVECLEKARHELTGKTIVDVGYRAGVGLAVTYNKILGEAKNDCKGEFSILESKQ